MATWKRAAVGWLPYAILLVVGAVAACLVAVASAALGWQGDAASARALEAELVIAGLLLVPASVFVPAVGAMFPSYWNATPVSVIEAGPLPWLLRLVALVLGYGLAALLLPTTLPVVALLAVLVGVGVVAALHSIAFALRILDPIGLATMLRDDCLAKPDPARAFGDLARLVRGLKDKERRDAVRQAIGFMQEAIEAREMEALAGGRSGELARNVLEDCRDKGSRDVADAARACLAAMDARGGARER